MLLRSALAFLFAAPASLSAQDAQGPSLGAARGDHAAAPALLAARAGGPIQVDGRLDEAAWAAAPAFTEFTQVDPHEGEPVSEPTEVRILYDDDALYVGARLRDSARPSTRLGRRDGMVPNSDWFAVALDSYHDHLTAFRFAVNPSGVRRDQVISGGGSLDPGAEGRGGDTSWDPVWGVATSVSDSGWVAELRIPFSQLRFGRGAAQLWGLQLERRINRKQEHALFAFTPKNEAAGVARYGHLRGIQGIQASRKLEVLPYVAARAEYRTVPANSDVEFANPFRSGRDRFSSAGLDLTYRLTSNVTVTATLNPDFGQVEVDPAVVNLTAFETRFEERRPFFVEGAELFRFGTAGGGGGGGGGFGGGFGGPGGRGFGGGGFAGFGGGGDGPNGRAQLIYSRRIGRAPQGEVPEEAVYSDVPEATTILGAAKVTGKTASGWAFGVVDAVTAREEAAYVHADGVRQRALVEPPSNYLAARVRRELRAGQSAFGAMFTAVNRELEAPSVAAQLRGKAYAGGVDFRHEWAQRSWSVQGFFAPSYISGGPEAIVEAQRSSAHYYQRPDAGHVRLDSAATSLAGYAARLDVGKRAGVWQGGVELSAMSPGYEVNDLGFQSTADRLSVETNFGYEQNRPGRVFRRWSARTGPDATWNYSGHPLEARVGLFLNGQLLNYWNGGLSLNHNFETYDDRLTRGGPLARQPASESVSANLSSDPRRAFTIMTFLRYSRDRAGGRRSSLGGSVGIRPAETWDLRISPNLSRTTTVAQYVTAVRDATATETFGRRYIFADLEQTTLTVETRLNVTFTPDLSLELYLQPLLSSGDYENLKEFRTPGTFTFDVYGTDRGGVARGTDGTYTIDPDGRGAAAPFQITDRDFNLRSLRGNAVLRWEWRPGSTLFLVWQQSRSESLTPATVDPSYGPVAEFDLARDARGLFGLRPDNIFLIKINYWWNP